MSINNIPVIIKGPDDKKILVVLGQDNIDTHYGTIEVGKITNLPVKINTSKGIELNIYIPSYREFVLNMKRGAQIIYPKDVASIILLLNSATSLIGIWPRSGSRPTQSSDSFF